MVIWIISDSTAFLCSKMYVLMAGCCAVSSRKSKGWDAESALQLCQVLVPGKHAFVGSQWPDHVTQNCLPYRSVMYVLTINPLAYMICFLQFTVYRKNWRTPKRRPGSEGTAGAVAKAGSSFEQTYPTTQPPWLSSICWGWIGQFQYVLLFAQNNSFFIAFELGDAMPEMGWKSLWFKAWSYLLLMKSKRWDV
jgi:hypothetical protein